MDNWFFEAVVISFCLKNRGFFLGGGGLGGEGGGPDECAGWIPFQVLMETFYLLIKILINIKTIR